MKLSFVVMVWPYNWLNKYGNNEKTINERKRNVTLNLRDWYGIFSSELGFEGRFFFYSGTYTPATISSINGVDVRVVDANLTNSSFATIEIYPQLTNEEAMRESLEVVNA